MSPESTSGHRAQAVIGTRRGFLAGGLALALATLLNACGGGGGGVAGVGSGGTGAFTSGTVTGFGSVFVNGIRYEDNGASLVDDDGMVKVLGTDDSPLKIGMVVEVTGSVDEGGTLRTATQIAYGAEVTGPVTAVGAGTFNVFGITVRTTTTTVYENFGGVGDLLEGNVVEVHGYPDANDGIVATLVERKSIPFEGEYRLRGKVSGLGGSPPAYTFTLRGVEVRTDANSDLDGTPANDVSVSVRLNPTPQGGRYLATRLKVRTASYGDSSTAAEAEIEGYVSGFTNANTAYYVAGYPVRLASGVVYEDGLAANLQNGIRVEAKGSIDNGVLIVTELEFKSADSDDDGVDDEITNGSQDYDFEFKGAATCTTNSCQGDSGTFTVRGVTVTYDGATVFEDRLSGATLNGRLVEVKSVGVLTDAGTTYRATLIRIDD